MDTKFGTNVSNRKLLNAAKFQVTPFTVFELLKENQQDGGRVKLPPTPTSPTQIRVKRQPHKMVKYAQTIRELLPPIYLSVFDYFVGLALKELASSIF